MTLVFAAQERRAEMEANGRALPGATAAVDALAEVTSVVQSVVTGNLRQIAELKLSLFGLDRHIDFGVGGYGSDDSDRATLCGWLASGLNASTVSRSWTAGR